MLCLCFLTLWPKFFLFIARESYTDPKKEYGFTIVMSTKVGIQNP